MTISNAETLKGSPDDGNLKRTASIQDIRSRSGVIPFEEHSALLTYYAEVQKACASLTLRNEELFDRASELERLLTSSRDEIIILTRRMEQVRRAERDVGKALSMRDQMIADKNALVGRLRAEIETLKRARWEMKDRARTAEGKLDSVLKSTSWRMMGPFRSVVRVLRLKRASPAP